MTWVHSRRRDRVRSWAWSGGRFSARTAPRRPRTQCTRGWRVAAVCAYTGEMTYEEWQAFISTHLPEPVAEDTIDLHERGTPRASRAWSSCASAFDVTVFEYAVEAEGPGACRQAPAHWWITGSRRRRQPRDVNRRRADCGGQRTGGSTGSEPAACAIAVVRLSGCATKASANRAPISHSTSCTDR